MRQVLRLTLIIGASALPAAAQVQSVPSFTGELREGFENLQTFFVPQLHCFDGAATANQVGGTLGLAVTGLFGGACSQMINEHSGTRFMLPWMGTNVEWVFEKPVRRFGGYFGTVCQDPGATASFYDEAGALIATIAMVCPTGGQWHWDGWEATGQGFTRVRIIATDLDGHVMHDDMQLDFIGDCYADCDDSGALTVADFSCFQARFVAGAFESDCNGSGTLTIADFACFQAAFVQGCP